MKRCTGCGEAKPLDDFSPDARRKDGRRARCRPCNATYVRTTTDPAKRRASDAARKPARNQRLKRRRQTDETWRRAEAEKCRIAHQRRQCGRTLAEIGEEEGWRCYLCFESVTEDEAEIEHIVPVSRGGPLQLRENVALAHEVCNKRKNARAIAALPWAHPSALDREAAALRAIEAAAA